MGKKIQIPEIDQAKILIGTLDVGDLENVLTYTRFILAQRRKEARESFQLVLSTTVSAAANSSIVPTVSTPGNLSVPATDFGNKRQQ